MVEHSKKLKEQLDPSYKKTICTYISGVFTTLGEDIRVAHNLVNFGCSGRKSDGQGLYILCLRSLSRGATSI